VLPLQRIVRSRPLGSRRPRTGPAARRLGRGYRRQPSNSRSRAAVHRRCGVSHGTWPSSLHILEPSRKHAVLHDWRRVLAFSAPGPVSSSEHTPPDL
jgi:hypothetical protein